MRTNQIGKPFSKDHIENLSKYRKGRKKSILHRKNLSKSNKGKRKVINLTTNRIFESITEAANYYNLAKSGIVQVCRGNRNSYGSYKWQYLEDNRKDKL